MTAHPARESTGLIPLPDLGTGMYKGEQGGLYPGGVNTPPTSHVRAGIALAKSIVPLDAQGRPSADGKIVMISVGMSNTTMKFQAFMKLAAEQKDLNPKLVLVDGAQGGQVAWVTSKAGTPYWDVVMERLQASGVTATQVQAAWLLQANPGPHEEFPKDTKELQRNITDTLHVMHEKFPNLKLTYLSSRTYAGYATSPLNPEPYAYESAFAVKWLIAAQIEQERSGKIDALAGDLGAAAAPWLAWSAYLWADGLQPRSDGLTWSRPELEGDGTHPAQAAEQKVGSLLLAFFKSEPTAKSWFLGAPPPRRRAAHH